MKIVNSKNIGYVSGAQVSPDHASKIFTGVIRGDLCSRNVANIFRVDYAWSGETCAPET